MCEKIIDKPPTNSTHPFREPKSMAASSDKWTSLIDFNGATRERYRQYAPTGWRQMNDVRCGADGLFGGGCIMNRSIPRTRIWGRKCCISGKCNVAST